MGVKQSKLVVLSIGAAISFGCMPAVAQSINCVQPLVFGDIYPCTSANTATITPAGTRSVSGCLAVGSAPFSNGRCAITQSFPFRPVQISVSAPVTLSNGTATMTINNFNIITAAGGSTYTASSAPFVNVPIGGTLNLGANQVGGTYSGSFTVNANLQ